MKRWRVLLLDTKRSNPNHYICLAIARALRESCTVATVIESSYATAIRDAQSEACDLFIAFDGEELDRVIVERLSRLCSRRVLWVTEDPYERSVNLRNMDLFDLVFTNDAGSVEAYGLKGRHLPFAGDERFHFFDLPVQDGEHYFYDLFFAGTAWPNRSSFLKQLKAAIPDIKLKLALPANPYVPEPELGIALSEYDWRTPNSEFARFANRSRTVLTLHRAFSSSDNDSVAHTPGPRFFEVALAGGFQLVDASIPDIRVHDYFEEGVEFISFDGAKDCADKLRYYLAHPQERLEVARKAQQRAMREHLYKNRVERLLGSLKAATAERSPVQAAPPKRPRLLIVSHNILGVEPYGGVEVYQESLRRALKDEFEILFYVPDRSILLGARYLLLDDSMDVLERFDCHTGFDDAALSCPERERIFARILHRHRIGLVHFQHLIGHVPALGFIPSSLGIRSVLSLHDYYSVCSRFDLLDYRGVYCRIPELPQATCDVCLNAAGGFAAGSQARRRAFFGRMLSTIDVLHANTEGVANVYRKIYPLLDSEDKIQVQGVPMPPDDEVADVSMRSASKSKGGPLRIAVLGNFTKNKGGDQLVHAFNQLRADNVEFTIIGRINPPYGEIFEALKLSNVRAHGTYKPGTLPRILAEYSMSMHMSIWPETYCISLSEAWHAGLVPIVTDIGALGERVTDGYDGFKVPVGEAGVIVDLVRRLATDRTAVERVRANIRGKMSVGFKEHMQWIRDLYTRLLPPEPFMDAGSNSFEWSGGALTDLGVLLVDRVWAIQSSGATIVANEEAGILATHDPGVLRRGYRFLRKNGLIKTVRRILLALDRKISQ